MLITLGYGIFSNFFSIGLTYLTTYDKILLDMTFGLRKQKKGVIKTISDYKMDILVRQGRDQFKKLIEKGINIPVALL